MPPVGPAGGSRELARWVKRLPRYLLRSPWSVQVPLLGAFKGPTATLAVHAHPLPGAPVWLWAEGVLHRPTHAVHWHFPRQTCSQIPTQAQERAEATGATITGAGFITQPKLPPTFSYPRGLSPGHLPQQRNTCTSSAAAWLSVPSDSTPAASC